MIASIDVCGLEEAALAEFERAEEARIADADIREISEIGRLSVKTEQLFRAVFQMGVTAHNGMVSTGRHAYSARWRSVDGFTRWWLCLVERCVDCGHEVATPFADRPSLGAILKARQTEAARCTSRRECGDRQRSTGR
jgi:hypothetical protein